MKITNDNLNQKDLIDNLFKMQGKILISDETTNTIDKEVVKNILTEIKKTNETQKQEWASALTEDDLKSMILTLTARGSYIKDELPKNNNPINFTLKTKPTLTSMLPPIGSLNTNDNHKDSENPFTDKKTPNP